MNRGGDTSHYPPQIQIFTLRDTVRHQRDGGESIDIDRASPRVSLSGPPTRSHVVLYYLPRLVR